MTISLVFCFLVNCIDKVEVSNLPRNAAYLTSIKKKKMFEKTPNNLENHVV